MEASNAQILVSLSLVSVVARLPRCVPITALRIGYRARGARTRAHTHMETRGTDGSIFSCKVDPRVTASMLLSPSNEVNGVSNHPPLSLSLSLSLCVSASLSLSICVSGCCRLSWVDRRATYAQDCFSLFSARLPVRGIGSQSSSTEQRL